MIGSPPKRDGRPSRVPLASVAALLRAVRDNGGVDARRAPVLAGMIARYAALEPLRLAERFAFDAAIDAHVPGGPPVFVLGHWRSGTSFLQTVLGADPRFTTSTLFRSLFGDVSAVSEPWLQPAMNAVARALSLPYSLQRLPLDLRIPAETDVSLFCQLTPHAYTWGHIFPRRFEAWMERAVLEPEPDFAAGWLDDLDRFVRKVSWAGGGRRVVVKSPGDTGRLHLLHQRWPEARFVVLHRDPVAVFHSSRYLWHVIRTEYALHHVTDAEVDAWILRTYPRLLDAYLARCAEVPEALRVDVRFESLRDDPAGTLERIYTHLGLGPVPGAVVRAAASAPPYAPRGPDTPPELEHRLREAWAVGFGIWSALP